MQRPTLHHALCNDSYEVRSINALFSFAERDLVFADWLKDAILSYFHAPLATFSLNEERHVCNALVPIDREAAFRRASWLVGSVLARRHPAHEYSLHLLHHWASTRVHEKPKAIVLGITIGVLPIGLMGEMKRKREPMGVFMRKDAHNSSKTLAFQRTLTSLTHRVVELGLTAAGGATAHLEPELGDWLFGDKALCFYQADQSTLARLKVEVAGLCVPHACTEDTFGVSMLVTTPALYVEQLDAAASLHALDE